MSKKKKDNIIKLDNDFSFEELVRSVANADANEVEESIRQNESEDAPIEESKEDCEPPQER